MPGANTHGYYLSNYSINFKLATDAGNSQNEIWTIKKRRNWSSCIKLTLRVSWTHGLIADGLKCMYIYWNGIFYIISIYIINIILHIYIYISIKNTKMSVHLEFLLIYAFSFMFGSPELHFVYTICEVSDLKLFKNVKVMFIFKMKLICYFN